MSSDNSALAEVASALKRKLKDEHGGSTPKRAAKCSIILKSVRQRPLSIAEAETANRANSAEMEAQEKTIRAKQQEILAWEKQIKDAKIFVNKGKRKQRGLAADMQKIFEFTLSDAARILAEIRSRGTVLPATSGSDFMEDMCTLHDHGNVTLSELTDFGKIIVSADKKNLQMGAFQFLVNLGDPSPTHLQALKILCATVLKDPAKSPHSVWPLLVAAMRVVAVDNELFCSGLCAKIKQMKEQTFYGSYDVKLDACPILHLLSPMSQIAGAEHHFAGLFVLEKLREELNESIKNAEPTTTDYSMPTEASIAKVFPVIQQFLLSSTETEIVLNLTKNGRMAVHRMIDNQIGRGKLSHSSAGSGRARLLVIRKVMAGPSKKRTNQERQKQYKELAAKMQEQPHAVKSEPF